MKQQGFLKGSAILLGMVLITKAVGLAYKIPLTHLLGGSGMAYYSGAFAVFAPLLAATVSGITASVARQTAEARALGRYAQLRKLRRTAMTCCCGIGFAASLMFTLLSLPLAKAFLPSAEAVWTLAALAPSLLFCSALAVQRGYYEGLRNMLPTAGSEIIETVLRAVLGLAGAYAVFRYAAADYAATHGCFGQFFRTPEAAAAAALPYAAAAAILAGSLATGAAVLSLAVSFRLRGDGITREMLASDPVTDPAPKIIRDLFGHSLPIALTAVITTLSALIDLLTVPRGLALSGSEVPPEFVYGSYTGLALTVCGIVPTLTAMLGKSSLPALTEASARRDGSGLSAAVSSLVRVSMLAALPCGAVITALPRECLQLLFGGRTGEIDCTFRALSVLGIGCCFISVSLPCLSALQTLRRRLTPILIMLAGSAVKLVLNLLLIPVPALGITGAAAAAAASQGIICLLSVRGLLKLTHTRIPGGVLAKPIFAALLGGAAGRLTYDLTDGFLPAAVSRRLLSPAAIAVSLFVSGLALWLMDSLPRERIKALAAGACPWPERGRRQGRAPAPNSAASNGVQENR
ncbi:stage V sporulation protein B [Ruminococcaceae bacterium FB2012]|nr:stage V sporulation protein B [Ruminococcaceae bacterium FB2012]